MAAPASKQAVVCVFCGASPGSDPVHLESARALAHEFHKNNVHLVYGGGTGGIMGEIAKTLVSLSGPEAVHGVIPNALVQVEEGYQDKSDDANAEGKSAERVVKNDSPSMSSEFGLITVVPDMHTRKRLMATKVLEGGPGSGFISLAGGFGTMEEVMEITTWNQIGIHHTGIVMLNINGYWDGIMAWVKSAVKQGFISEKNAGILGETKDVHQVLKMLREYTVSPERLQLNWGQE
ncbi:hypothetical protein BDV25DRAFT_163803 [Aspergillus avenaceus]|uniref:Lysine decarboxylase-like protein n=1 Tax=Aspergillus avenaceus TaxID=36643 RepID=A0A5N6TI80_ASPAV|nr:hypothetical protein BDV25DRAFT_163803 [Aspergillus avenaceus]